jgi:murein DD-endopeptidase MepM/ murein hydrolase activator NlpD
MSIGRVRAIAWSAMALFAFGTVAITRPLPRVALATAARAEQGPDRRVRHDTLGPRETLVHVFVRAGMSAAEARVAMGATHLLQPGVIRVGMPLQFSSRASEPQPTHVRIGLAIDRYLNLKKTETGWVGYEEMLSWTIDTIVVTGVISSHLTAAVDSAAKSQLGAVQRRQLTYALADLYEFRVDMSRDLRVGDSFTVVAERQSGPEGAVRIGRVIVASMKLSRTVVDAIPFKSAKVSGEFFDGEGKPLRCCFLRAPLEFRRISSRFGLRRHPILGTMRRHEGTDYAASAGTPVRAIGAGVVIKAGWGNGYGNMIEVRHPNGFVTRYGHMIGFAKGIARGSRVEVGRTIGYVGATGLATGPHLHFEVLVNGAQRDPRIALGKTGSLAIPAAEKHMFAMARSEALALLRSPTQLANSDTPDAKSAPPNQTTPQR